MIDTNIQNTGGNMEYSVEIVQYIMDYLKCLRKKSYYKHGGYYKQTPLCLLFAKT